MIHHHHHHHHHHRALGHSDTVATTSTTTSSISSKVFCAFRAPVIMILHGSDFRGESQTVYDDELIRLIDSPAYYY